MVAAGEAADDVAKKLISQLADPSLALVLVFHDWRIDPHALAHALHRGLPNVPTAGCTTTGALGPGPGTATALALYGDWLRAGIGVASELAKTPLVKSRDAVSTAAQQLGETAESLVQGRHLGVGLLDGTCGHEEAFCIGSAATAPQIPFVGGAAGTEPSSDKRALVWAQGEALADAGVVILLESKLPCTPILSSHLVPTDARTVVTAANGRMLIELDGKPAPQRLAELVEAHGEMLAFARIVDGIPYVRSILTSDRDGVLLRTAVEPGHVLRVMRAGDLIGSTKRDLAAAADRVGGSMSALLAFSCIARHWEARTTGVERDLLDCYAQYPTIGCESFGEQSGMLLVNHTLTGLAIGAPA